MPDRPALEDYLPLKPVDFHVLLVLTDGALHGYGIVKEIEARSGGAIRLEPGNLYRYIRKLVENGMVEPAERRSVHPEGAGAPNSRPAGGGGGVEERRRYYRVTSLGREVLAADAVRMRDLVAAADARLTLPPR